MIFNLLVLIILNCLCINSARENTENEAGKNPEVKFNHPTVVISILVRNKAHLLPHFLSYLENLNYPKDKIDLWIRSDNNADNSIEILNMWLSRISGQYNQVNYINNVGNKGYAIQSEGLNETAEHLWTRDRFKHVMKLKEESLNYARGLGTNYIFFLDADVFLVHANVLIDLITLYLPIVAPMVASETDFANFWPDSADKENKFDDILNYKKKGNFLVPLVHSAFLIDLSFPNTKYLTFDKYMLLELHKINTEFNDLEVFSLSAAKSIVPMYITNSKRYGYMMNPQTEPADEKTKFQLLTNVRNLIVNQFDELQVVDDLKPYAIYPEKDTLSLSKIYVINLKRRSDRRRKREETFKVLGLEVEFFEAVDGKTLTNEKLKELNIKLFPGFVDPFSKRRMTMGEIGCFLSHYSIWKEIVAKNLSEVLIMEDDTIFDANFRPNAELLLKEARATGITWDLIFLARKAMAQGGERVPGTSTLVTVKYSYWLNSYIVTLDCAKKLLAPEPLQRMLPADEYVPIMFNEHPNDTIKNAFENRTIVAWSASPLLQFPAYFRGDSKYVSDTENSAITNKDEFKLSDGGENIPALDQLDNLISVELQKLTNAANLVQSKPSHTEF